MTTDLVPIPNKAAALAAEYAYSGETRGKYGKDFAEFEAWCAARGVPCLPAAPATVVDWLADHESRYAVATLKRHMAAINSAHSWLGYDPPARSSRHPEVALIWRAICRKNGTAAQHAKRPLLTEHVLALLQDLRGRSVVRDKAMILLAFAGAFRRSEMCGFDLSDVQAHKKGLTVTLRRSKTDQAAAGRLIGIPRGAERDTCPVVAMQRWLEARGEEPGALFPSCRGVRMTPQSFRLIVVNACRRAGLGSEYSAHSLRSGFVTQAIRGGASDHAVMDQTGHKDAQMVRRYRREAELFLDNAAGRLGL